MPKKSLIINADDYGLTSAVSSGIREAHLKGILSSTTVMASGLTVDQDLPILLRECPEIGIGVHLTLTTLNPILNPSSIASLVTEAGKFYSLKDILNRTTELSEEQLYSEWKVQIEKIISFGVKPDHLDSHHSACLFSEKTVAVMIKLAKEFQLPVRAPFSSNNSSLVAYTKNELDKNGIKYPNAFVGNFTGNNVEEAHLAEILNQLEPGVTEIMSHPGFIDDDLRRISSLVDTRVTEVSSLCSVKIGNLLLENDIELSTFGRVFKES